MTNGVAELLVPFFLAGMGLRLALTVFCGLGAFSLGKKNILRIGVGMAPHGEVGMVVSQLGCRWVW
jgi:Kef-type K+ transport system membrane component KefB